MTFFVKFTWEHSMWRISSIGSGQSIEEVMTIMGVITERFPTTASINIIRTEKEQTMRLMELWIGL